MPLVIVRHRAAATGLEAQAGLRAIQRLDLAFLIHAEDDGMLGRVQRQAHHILQLVLEVRIPAELKGPDSVGCKLKPIGVEAAIRRISFDTIEYLF